MQTMDEPDFKVGNVAVMTNPEVSLAIMTKGMVAQMMAEGENDDAHVAIISEQLTSHKLTPITAVVLEGSDDDVTSHLPNIPKLIMAPGDETVLNVDMLDPVAVIWTMDLAKGLHADNPVKILARSANSLEISNRRLQLKLIQALYENPGAINDEQITHLVHHELQHTLLSYVKQRNQDITFESGHLQVLHRQMHANLHLQLTAAHRHDSVAAMVLEDQNFKAHLMEKAHCCPQLPDVNDQELNALLLYHNRLISTATEELVTSTEQLQTQVLQASEAQVELTKLRKSKQQLEHDTVTLVARLNDKTVTEQAPPGVKPEHYKAVDLDKDSYSHLMQASRKHTLDLPETVLHDWKEAKDFVQTMKKKGHTEQTVIQLASEYQAIKDLLHPDGSLPDRNLDALKTVLLNAGLHETDIAPVKKLVSGLQDHNEHSIKQLFTEITDHLEQVDLDEVTPDMIVVTRTGLHYESVLRYKNIAENAPELFETVIENSRLRQWLQSLEQPSEVIDHETLRLMASQPELLDADFHEAFTAIHNAEWSSAPKAGQAKRLLAFGELMTELEAQSHQGVMTELSNNLQQALQLTHDEHSQPLKAEGLQKFNQFVMDELGAEAHNAGILKVVQTITPEDIPTLIQLWPKYKELYKQGMISEATLRIGQHSIHHLTNAHEAHLHMPTELESCFSTIKKAETINQKLVNFQHLVQVMTDASRVPAPDELVLFPEKGGFATQEETTILEHLLFSEDYGAESAKYFVNLMAQMHSLAQASAADDSLDETFATLQQNWATLSGYIQSGTIKENMVNDFKDVMTALKLDPENEELRDNLVSLVPKFSDADQIPKILEHYKQVCKVMDVATLKYEKVRAVKWELTEDQVEAARLLLEQDAEIYNSLHAQSWQREAQQNSLLTLEEQFDELEERLPQIVGQPEANLSERAKRLSEDLNQKQREVEHLTTKSQNADADADSELQAARRELEDLEQIKARINTLLDEPPTTATTEDTPSKSVTIGDTDRQDSLGMLEQQYRHLKATTSEALNKAQSLESDISAAEVKRREIQTTLDSTLEELASVKETEAELHQLLTDSEQPAAGASNTPSTLAQKATHLSESLTRHKETAEQLQDRVQQLTKQLEPAVKSHQRSVSLGSIGTKPQNDGQTQLELAHAKEQLAQATDKHNEALQKLSKIEEELANLEAVGQLDKGSHDLPTRLQAASDYITTTQATADELTKTKAHYKVVHSHAGRLVDPADLKSEVPPAQAYELLKSVAKKHDSLPESTLQYHLKTVEDLVVKIQQDSDAANILMKMKGQMAGVPQFCSNGVITEETLFNSFQDKTGFPDTLRDDLTRVMSVIKPEQWSGYADDVVQLVDNNLRPSKIPVTHWTLARSSLSHQQLEDMADVAAEMPEYEVIHATEWLGQVKHRIPTIDQLQNFPDELPSDSEFAPLLPLMQHHPDKTEAALLTQLIKFHDFWSQFMKGKNKVITYDDFLHLQSTLHEHTSTESFGVARRLELFEQNQQLDKLSAALRYVNSFDEFSTLLTDVEQLDPLLSDPTNRLTVGVLAVAREGYTPKVLRLARSASDANPKWYRDRRDAIDMDVFFHRSLDAIKHPTKLAIMAADENTLDIIQGMSDSGSPVYQAIHEVVSQIPLKSGASVDSVHRDLVMAYQIIGSVTMEKIDTFINSFKLAYHTARQRYTQGDMSALDEVLNKYKLTPHKGLILQIIDNSELVPTNIDLYVKLSTGHSQHLRGPVPLATLSAAYEGHTPESFAELRVLLASKSSDMRQVAKDARVSTQYHYHEKQYSEYEELQDQLETVSHRLKEIDHAKIERHKELQLQFHRIKQRFAKAKFKYPHTLKHEEHTSEELLARIHKSKTLQELTRTSGDFLNHHEVLVAKEVMSYADALIPSLEAMPPTASIQDFSKVENAPAKVQAAANQWLDAHKTEDSTGENPTASALRPLMEAFAKETDVASKWSELENKAHSWLGGQGEKSDATSVITIQRIESAHDNFKILQDTQQMPDGGIITQKRMSQIKTAAQALVDDVEKLSTWLGEKPNEGSATVDTVRTRLNQLTLTSTAETVNENLNTLFAESAVTQGMKGNEPVTLIAAQLKAAQPHFNIGIQLDQALPVLKSALQDTRNVIRKHQEAVPQLAVQIPQDDTLAQQLSTLNIVQEADRIVGRVSEIETNALAEIRETADLIADMNGQLTPELAKGDFDQLTVLKHSNAIEAAQDFCKTCASKTAQQPGNNVFKDLVTDEGKLDQDQADLINGALYKLSQQERKLTETYKVMLEDTDGTAAKILKHDQTSGMMTDAIPDGTLELVERIRTHSSDNHRKLMYMIESQEITEELDDTLKDIGATDAETKLIQQLIHGTIKITAPPSADDAPMMTEDGDFDLPVYYLAKADEHSATLRMTHTLQYLDANVPDFEMQQAVLILKDAVITKGLDIDDLPHESPSSIKMHFRTIYDDPELSDDMLDNTASWIFRGAQKSANSWAEISRAVNEIPLLKGDMLKPAVKQMRHQSAEQAKQFLNSNTAFKHFMHRSELVKKMVTLVRNYHLTVEALEEIRDSNIKNPNAAKLLALTDDEVALLRSRESMPNDVWASMMEALKDSGSLGFKATAWYTSKNITHALYAFIWEFFIDDMTRYGGTGSIAITLGAANSWLEQLGIPKEMMVRAMMTYLEEYITSPEGQKHMAMLSPLLGAYQVNRVRKDVYDLIVTKEMSTTTGQGMSAAFLLLTWLNELAWGGPLTHQMVLALRAGDSVVSLQDHLKAYIREANTQFRYKKITSDELQEILQTCVTALDNIDESNPDWESHIDDSIEILRGRAPDEDLDKLKHQIHHGYQYRRIAKGWHNGVDRVSEALSPLRPITHVVGDSFPKAMLARGILHPALLWGARGAGKAFPLLEIPSRLMLGGVVSSTGLALGTQLVWDGMYNDFNGIRKAFYPVANMVDRHLFGINFERADELGLTPYSLSKTLNDTTSYLSFSAPGNMWMGMANTPAYLLDTVIGSDPNSEESLTHSFDQTITSKVLGHQHSYIGAAAKWTGSTIASYIGTGLGTLLWGAHQAYHRLTGSVTPEQSEREPGKQFDLQHHDKDATSLSYLNLTAPEHRDKKKGVYSWFNAGGPSQYQLRTDLAEPVLIHEPGSSFKGSVPLDQRDKAAPSQDKQQGSKDTPPPSAAKGTKTFAAKPSEKGNTDPKPPTKGDTGSKTPKKPKKKKGGPMSF